MSSSYGYMNKLFCALTHVAKSVQSRATSARVYYILKHVCAYVRKYINVIKKRHTDKQLITTYECRCGRLEIVNVKEKQ